ncbi:MAG TPA: sigma-70 family RNA polymerase sigma factor [Planctomycetaceae bacterium]|jgi:RNA polymerase sigma-70 factor (ECF subfamily)
MHETPKSLLDRIRHGSENSDWQQLTDLYTPFLRRIVQHFGVSGAECDDLIQDVFIVLVREIGNFEHNQQRGAFRRWLRLITLNRLRGARRSRGTLKAASFDPAVFLDNWPDTSNDLERLWDDEHDTWVARKLLEILEPEFTMSTWQAFYRQVVDGRPAAEVAGELGLSTNAVLIAKSRVLRRFRAEIKGLIE